MQILLKRFAKVYYIKCRYTYTKYDLNVIDLIGGTPINLLDPFK